MIFSTTSDWLQSKAEIWLWWKYLITVFFVPPFNYPKPNMQLHKRQREIQIALKIINILQYMLVSKLWTCDKNYNMCKRRHFEVLVSINSTIHPFSQIICRPRVLKSLVIYKNTSYLKTNIIIENCRNSWHIEKNWALFYFLTLYRFSFVVHSTSIYRICVKSSLRQVSNKRSCTKELYSYSYDHRLLYNCF